MAGVSVSVFFYGSFMNLEVLKEVDVVAEGCQPAKVGGFDIVIQPRANLVPSERHCVYGIVVSVTHAELDRLYDHAKSVLGETYLPQAVLAETLSGYWKPALCYIAPSMEVRPAAKDYVDRIVKAAREFNFPEWYIERLESFRR
jgi:hypothetical protein